MVVIFVVGFYTGNILEKQKFVDFINQFKSQRMASSKYLYTSPLIGIDSPKATTFGLYTDLHDVIQNRINQAKKVGVDYVAVYVRDLNSSLWFGIDEFFFFFSASLLKLPFAFAAYKATENDKELRDSKFIYTQELANINLKRVNASPSELIVGSSYTLRDLVRIMLEDSDYGARDMVAMFTPADAIQEIYTVIGLNVPNPSVSFQMSAKAYALFFRMLYGATYLNEQNSNTILKLLNESSFDLGIKRYIPKTIVVSHKWGVLNLPKDEKGVEEQELHDCGVVYAPDRPYIICIMTKGPDQQVLADVIADISKETYNYFTLGK